MNDQDPSAADRRGVLVWLVRHPKTTVTLCLLLLFAIFAFGTATVAERSLTRKIAAIRSKGEPVSVDDLAALRSILGDSGKRIAEVARIADGTIKLKICEPTWGCVASEDPKKSAPTGEAWSTECLKACRDCLESIAEERRSLHDALKLDGKYLPISWSSPALLVKIPGLPGIRQAARILGMEAGVAAESGDRRSAERAILDLSSLSPFCGPDAPLIVSYVEGLVDRIIADCIERTINRYGLSADCLRRLQDQLHNAELSLDLKPRLLVERVFFIDTFSCLRSGLNSPAAYFGGTNLQTLLWRHTQVVRSMDENAGIGDYGRMIDAIDGPTMTTLTRLKAVNPADSWYALYARILGPSINQSAVIWLRLAGQLRAMQVAIAAERYRLAHGRWPEQATDLVPMYLAAVPKDPIDGKPIRYAKISEGIKTWTISSDESNADEGGDVGRLEGYVQGKRVKDTGWVILNPELRGRPAEEKAATSGPATSKPTVQSSPLKGDGM